MATQVKTNLDFENNEIKNVRIDNRDTVPTAVQGGFYFNTKNKSFYFCDGTTFFPLLKLATDAEITAGTSTAKAVSVKQLADEIAKIITDVTLEGTPQAPTAATGTNTTQIATTAFVQQEITSAISGAITYRGNWNTTDATDFSGLNAFLPIKRGNGFRCTGNGCTIGGIEYRADDFIIFNQDCSANIASAMIDKYDHTLSDDVVLKDAEQTLTNKIIDALNNTISNLSISAFRVGEVVTSATSGNVKLITSGGVYTAVASKANLASPTFTGTPKAPTAATGTNTTQLATTAFVQQEIAAKTTVKIITVLNPALTVSNGKCEWTITHNLNSENLQIQIYETTGKTQVIADAQIVSATQIKITLNSTANITAEKYKAVLMG